MAIQSNVGQNVTGFASQASGDTTLLTGSATGNRQAVTGFSLFNTQSTNRVVTIYESPDATSASGKEVATYNIPPTSSVDVVECIGQGYGAGIYLVGKQTTSGAAANDVNFKITTTQYTAGS